MTIGDSCFEFMAALERPDADPRLAVEELLREAQHYKEGWGRYRECRVLERVAETVIETWGSVDCHVPWLRLVRLARELSVVGGPPGTASGDEVERWLKVMLNDLDCYCPDCDAKPGQLHHDGCDAECCPDCGLQ
jgi:hypothetical protein